MQNEYWPFKVNALHAASCVLARMLKYIDAKTLGEVARNLPIIIEELGMAKEIIEKRKKTNQETMKLTHEIIEELSSLERYLEDIHSHLSALLETKQLAATTTPNAEPTTATTIKQTSSAAPGNPMK